MGKVSVKDRESKSSRQKKRSRRASSKYLKPGALSEIRYSKASGTRSCTDLGKKRVAVLDVKKDEKSLSTEHRTADRTPPMLSPVSVVKQDYMPEQVAATASGKAVDNVVGTEGALIDRSFDFPSPVNYIKQNNMLRTPKTPRFEDSDSESRLEALPMDLLVKICCHLHHDQLRAVFHVSQKIRQAVQVAWQFHFNYTTPDRSRQEMLRLVTPRPTDRWPFKREGKGVLLKSPLTPKAPRPGPRPPSRIKLSEMRQIAAVLFQEKSTFPPSRCIVPSVLSKPVCKSLASNRALFYEEELCKAVAKNKLR